MLTRATIQLLNIWKNNIFAELSIVEIMETTNKNTKTWVFNALQKLVKSNLLVTKRKSNLDLYSLKRTNPLVYSYLQFLEAEEHTSFAAIKFIEEILEKLPVKTYVLIVFGSYATGKTKKSSDLDLCILIENAMVEKKIKPYINDIKLSYATPIDEHYITFADFSAMLLRPEENLAKQIVKQHILFYNADLYYQIINEAYHHGFRQ